MRRAGVDPAPSRFAFYIRHHDADIPASVARRRVARASRAGADRVPSPPPLPNPQVHPQGAVFQVQVRRASSSLVSGERSRSLATAPRRDFGDLDLRRGIPRTSRGASRDATDAHLDAFAEERRVARRSASSAAARGDLRVVRSRPSCDRSAYPRRTKRRHFFFFFSEKVGRLRNANAPRRTFATDLRALHFPSTFL